MDGDAFRRLLDGASVGIAELDSRGVIVQANARLLAMSGRTSVVGTPLRDLVHEADRHTLDEPHPVDVRIADRWVSIEISSGSVACFTDVTERQEQLRASIAHDFKNMLTVILSNAAVLLRRGGLDERAQADLGQIVEASERATVLSRQLLSLSGRKALPDRVPSGTEPPLDVDTHRRR